ncbi:MAG TPA: periplasmic heavy metal sensor [Candidatus Sulfotelmatobacter sp.]|jgi:uncharacterized membrane protein|nr:periplasmic heavy metal sensor [Candidatus Sulfotelmatobacter sp.]
MRSFSRSRRLGPLLLTLSLGLNLFLGGWIVSQGLPTLRFDKHGLPPEQAAEAIAKTLPDADAEILRHVMSGRAPQMNAARRDAIEATKHLREAMTAEPLDPAALREAFDRMRAARQAERGLFAETIIDILPQMSLEGRQAFIKTQMVGHP